MGRFITDLAATMANADNLPPKEALPNVSLWDAFLPQRCVKHQRPLNDEKPIDPTVGMRVYREFYNVKKDKDGKKMIVVKKNGEPSDKGKVMLEDVKKSGNGNGNGGGGNGKNGNGNKGGDGGNAKGGGEEKKEGGGFRGQDVPFTEEEDAKLKQMKAEEKSWAVIVAEMNRPKKMLQNRFKEIGGETGDAAAKKDDDNKNGNAGGGKKQNNQKNQDKAKDDNKQANKRTNADKKANNQPAAKASSAKAPSKAGSNGEARFTMGEWMTLQEDDLFSFGELQCLSELIVRDAHQRWLRVASMFADKTGRRVHPDDIREKFEEIGRMG